MVLQVKTSLWRPAKNKTESLNWTKKLNKLLSLEEEQVPQWIESLGVELPEYGYLSNIHQRNIGWKLSNNQNTQTSECTLVRTIENEPISYFSLTTTYNQIEKSLEINIRDFYISPEYRHTIISKELVQEIANIIILQHNRCTLNTPVYLKILIGSIKGDHIFNKLQNILNNANVNIETNKTVDPTY